MTTVVVVWTLVVMPLLAGVGAAHMVLASCSLVRRVRGRRGPVSRSVQGGSVGADPARARAEPAVGSAIDRPVARLATAGSVGGVVGVEQRLPGLAGVRDHFSEPCHERGPIFGAEGRKLLIGEERRDGPRPRLEDGAPDAHPKRRPGHVTDTNRISGAIR